jgi:lysophospholipase L1-like esterase
MFGGSTLWGYGARDEFTIPSQVAKKLTTRLETGVWVTNFAENGYVSTQEVIALMLELRKGNVPDVVAFFDGVNDTFAAFQSGVAGIPQNESNRVVEFDLLQRVSWRQAVVERLALYRLSLGAVRSLGLSRSTSPVQANVASTDALARAVVDVYLQNVTLVETLAQQFGFRAVFFWQPTVLTKKHMSQQERLWYEQPGRRFVRAAPFFGQVRAALTERLGTRTVDDVHDLSGVFDEMRGGVFIDEFHVSEAGNEKIAEIVARTLQKGAQDRPR